MTSPDLPSRQAVLPPVFGRVHSGRQSPWVAILFTTLISYGLISYVVLGSGSTVVSLLGGTTSLLLLAVFTIVNIAVLVLRRDDVGRHEADARAESPPSRREHDATSRTPTVGKTRA